MYNNLELYHCGGCGGTTYNNYKLKGSNCKIIVVCRECNSESEIVITPSILEVRGVAADNNTKGIMHIP